jgi:hypothetical protein
MPRVSRFTAIALVAGCVACRRNVTTDVTKDTTGAGSAAPMSSSAEARPAQAPAASVSASTSAAGALPPAPVAPGCPEYAAALARGRKATADGRFEQAILAFDDAVRAAPVDARARAERGWAYFRWGKAARALQDLENAKALTKDAALLGSIWFNLGLALEGLGKPDDVRIAFAASATHGSAAAKKKLGDGSTCPAAWRVLSGKDAGEGPIATSFAELAKERQVINCEVPPPPVGATQAQIDHNGACHGCGYGQKDEGDQCDAAGAGVVSSGYMHFHWHQFYIVPLDKDRWWYANVVDSRDRPDVHVEAGYVVAKEGRGESLPTFSSGGFVSGDFLHGGIDEVYVQANGGWSDQVDIEGNLLADGGARCSPDMRAQVELDQINAAQMGGTPAIPASPPRSVTLFSLASRRALFTFAAYAGNVTLTVRPGSVRILGDGCDATVAIGR